MGIKQRARKMGSALLDKMAGSRLLVYLITAAVFFPLATLIGYKTMGYSLEYWTDYEITVSIWTLLAGAFGSQFWVPAAIVTFFLSFVL